MNYPQGTAIKLTETFTVEDVLTDPTTVTFHVLDPLGVDNTYTGGQLTHVSTGVYALPLSPPTVLGTFLYWAVGTGAVEATSAPRSFTVTSVLDGNVEGGPCEPWVSSDEVEECCEASESSTDFQEAADAATRVLFQLVPRFSGTCGPRRVRPCGTGCTGGLWANFMWSGVDWMTASALSSISPLVVPPEPYPSNRGCGCRPLSRVLLAGHVRDVLEVTVDGATVDPATYRLDNHKWLTRLPDPADPDTRLFWPSCQDMEAAETDVGTFSVLYTFGVAPPSPARLAARELACAIFKTACGGTTDVEDCPLPNNVTRVVRQGITIDLMAFTGWGFDPVRRQWQTGMPLVDMFLNAYNPNGRRRRRARVWSPDMDKAAPKLGQ